MNPNTQLPFQPDIQGLRAISILLVVLCHANLFLFGGGFIGVDLFFVISGYLITGLLLREHQGSGRIQYARFIGRRLKRLLPSLLAVILATTVAASFVLSGFELREQMGSLIYAITWTSNLFFAFSDADYFAELASKDLFLHTWSLGVEEQFYLLWPLLISLIGSLGITGHKPSVVRFLGFLFFTSLALCVYQSTQNSLYAFYLMPMRIWQFSLGALVYVIFQDRPLTTHSTLMRLAALLLIGLSSILFSPEIGYPGLWALAPSLGAALLLATSGSNTPSAFLSHPLLRWIGDRSYAWYLWHWPFLMLGPSLMGGSPTLLMNLLLAAGALAASALSYRWIELPFWRGPLSQAAPGRTILVSMLAMVVAASAGLLQINARTPPSTDPVQRVIAQARTDLPEIYSAGCDSWYYNAEVKACIGGNPSADQTLVFIGDSIGAQWYSALADIYGDGQWRIEVYTKSACPIVDEDYFYPRIGAVYAVCKEWRDNLLAQLKTRRVDTTIIGSSGTYDFSAEQWIQGSARILKTLSKISNQVLIIAGAPELSKDVPGCISRTYRNDPKSLATPTNICTKSIADTQAPVVAGYLAKSTGLFPNAYLLNLNDLICPNGLCLSLSEQGIIVYRDSKHLTDSFVRSRVPEIRARIQQLLASAGTDTAPPSD
ncbi:acyltransferase family protein [Aestuariirhabdus litorea]|nr:acyltransferase family protein [Aestuariirhabdus litorea]